METDCNLNCDSILKKAKWLIIAMSVWEVCLSLIYSLAIPWMLFYVLYDTENKHLYLAYMTGVFNLIYYLLDLFACLCLRKFPNKVVKQTANIFLFILITQIIYFHLICPLLGSFFEIKLSGGIPNLLTGVLWTYFYIMAYGNLLKDKVIRKVYIYPIYLLCLGTIIMRFGNIPYTILDIVIPDSSSWDLGVSFSNIDAIARLILELAGYILIIFGWKKLLSTPSQIPPTISASPISLKPTKMEYGYLASCGVLIALLFIYFNSVSLDIFTK